MYTASHRNVYYTWRLNCTETHSTKNTTWTSMKFVGVWQTNTNSKPCFIREKLVHLIVHIYLNCVFTISKIIICLQNHMPFTHGVTHDWQTCDTIYFWENASDTCKCEWSISNTENLRHSHMCCFFTGTVNSFRFPKITHIKNA